MPIKHRQSKKQPAITKLGEFEAIGQSIRATENASAATHGEVEYGG